MTNEDALATVLLVGRFASAGVEPLKAAEYWQLLDRVGAPGALLGQTEGGLRDDHRLEPELATRVGALVDRATSIAFELDRLDQSGIATLTPFDAHYPQRFVERLAARAPPMLHAAGRLDLLDAPGVGIVGSSDIDDDAAGAAEAAARVAVDHGRSVVSGGAQGVDQLAMRAATDAGGTTVAVLADSLATTLRRPDVRRAIHDGRTVMCTPYGPDAPFSTGTAMGRNKLVYAQSLLTLVVASDLEAGEAWAGAIEALRHRFGRVAVWRGAGEGSGNDALEQQGATPVGSGTDLEAALRDPEPPAGTRPQPVTLF